MPPSITEHPHDWVYAELCPGSCTPKIGLLPATTNQAASAFTQAPTNTRSGELDALVASRNRRHNILEDSIWRLYLMTRACTQPAQTLRVRRMQVVSTLIKLRTQPAAQKTSISTADPAPSEMRIGEQMAQKLGEGVHGIYKGRYRTSRNKGRARISVSQSFNS